MVKAVIMKFYLSAWRRDWAMTLSARRFNAAESNGSPTRSLASREGTDHKQRPCNGSGLDARLGDYKWFGKQYFNHQTIDD